MFGMMGLRGAASRALLLTIQREYIGGFAGITLFNDAKSITDDDVFDVMRRTAKELREHGS
jgi:hypothetical protein